MRYSLIARFLLSPTPSRASNPVAQGHTAASSAGDPNPGVSQAQCVLAAGVRRPNEVAVRRPFTKVVLRVRVERDRVPLNLLDAPSSSPFFRETAQ